MRNWHIDDWIRLLVGGTGLLLASATVPIFFSIDWMSQIHRWLGLGDFPDSPITIYLARSTSIMYAVHGYVMIFVALKYRELKAMVPLIGAIHAAMGLVLLYVDFNSGMPTWWTLLEGPPVCIFGVLLLWLYLRSRSRANAAPSG